MPAAVMRLRRGVGIIGAVVLLAALPSSARAEDRPGARRAFQEGRRHYDLGEYEQALESFKQAYHRYEDPVFLFNFAQCHRALGRKQEAINSYKSYLRNAKSLANRDEVQKIIGTLEASVAAEKAARDALPPREEPAQPGAAPGAGVTADGATAAMVSGPLPNRRAPFYSKRWFWAVVGVVAMGAATGIAVGVTYGGPTQPSLVRLVFP